MKKFEEVKIGDPAYSCDLEEYTGAVIAKGTLSKLIKEGWATTFFEDEDVQGLENEPAVVVSLNPENTLEGYSHLIFLYDFDPCSVYCKS